MITVYDLTLAYSGQPLFSHVDLQFTKGNCYGIIGANGAGKSTFLKILSGDLEATSGEVSILPKTRMSVLKQDQNAYNAYSVMDTVIMGNQRLYDIGKEKDALYEKEEMTEADGIRACELEEEFAELGGWEAESDASRILQGLGVGTEFHQTTMENLDARLKVKVLLAQALFGNPDILLLDEPTNNLDINAVNWLEDFLLDFEGTVIVVSHDRHFLNTICTHIVDIDYNKIKLYVGNYDFWYDASQLMQNLMKNQNKKNEEKAQELKEFISRFSANKSKSKQATARRKLLEKITLEEIPASSRRYPWVAFSPDREVGKDILFVTDVSKTIDGVKVLDKVRTPRPPSSRSSPASWSPTRAPSSGARPPPSPTSPRTTLSSSRTATTTWWSGCASGPPTPTRPISGAFWAGCSSPGTRCTSPSRSSPAARRCGACSPG